MKEFFIALKANKSSLKVKYFCNFINLTFENGVDIG
jgi:hypothetical protein